jgi:hypothetical protein
MARAGHHGDVLYKFEDNGFDATPNDSVYKVFGGNVTMETFEGSHQAVRVLNADRKAAQIVEQVFDGAWSVSGTITEPPWWLQSIYGAPNSSNTAGDLYTHEYALSNGNDPTPLRLYTPTEGFSEVEVLGGAVVSNLTVDQSQPNNPEFTLTGAYASEPTRESLSPSVPTFAERTFSNREGQLDVGADTVGKVQNASVDLETGAELVGEIGSGEMVDWRPGQFNPGVTYDKIISTSQTVDPLDRFLGADETDQVTVTLNFDNGKTGDAQYAVQFDVTGAFPNDWSESGRNDPEADLMEELTEMAEDMTVTITEDESAPPT